MRREFCDPEQLAEARRLEDLPAVLDPPSAAQRVRHRRAVQRRVSVSTGEQEFMVAAERLGLVEDLHRQIGERLVDHAPLLDPPRRDIDAGHTVVVVQLVAMDVQRLGTAQHGGQHEFDRQPLSCGPTAGRCDRGRATTS